MIALTVTAFTSESISNIAGPLEYKGYVSFAYTEGENPINHIAFTIDMAIAPDLLIINIPSGWGYIYEGGVLSLSGGSLSPGGIVNVQVSLNSHHLPGDYHVDAVGTTTAGETVSTSGVLMVGETYILMFLAALYSLRYPLAASIFGLGFIEIWWGTKRAKIQDELENMGWVSSDEPDIVQAPLAPLDDDVGGEVLPVEPFENEVIIEPDDGDLIIETTPTEFDLPPELDESVILPGKIQEIETQAQPPNPSSVDLDKTSPLLETDPEDPKKWAEFEEWVESIEREERAGSPETKEPDTGAHKRKEKQ